MRARTALLFFFFIMSTLIPVSLRAQGNSPAANALVIIDLPDHSRMADVKDTNYTRILDGMYIAPGYVIKVPFREVAYVGNKEDVKMLGVKSEKPLMLVNTKDYPVEGEIDSLLQTQKQHPDFPSYVKLPLVLNGHLLSFEERKIILPCLTVKEIKEVQYLNPAQALPGFGDTPFGLIEMKALSLK